MTHPGIEMIGREVYDAVTDGRVHYEAIKAVMKPIRRVLRRR